MTVAAASPKTPQVSTFTLNGATLCALAESALFWPDRKTLVVADLHFEKGSSFARSGQLLPPYDSRATLASLAALVSRLQPLRVVCLGDSFHDRVAAQRLSPEDRAKIIDLTRSVEWIWIAGNHDPAPPSDLGGEVCEILTDGPLVFRHEAKREPVAGEISGHYHPKARVPMRGRALSGRCFIEDGMRLILPAFGSYTGGLDVQNPAISHLFPKGYSVHLVCKPGIVSVPKSRLLRGNSRQTMSFSRTNRV